MFKSFAITLCRVFITQQKISTPLSAKRYLCDICAFLNILCNWESFRICVCVRVVFQCVFVCVYFYCIFDALQTTSLSKIPQLNISYKLKPDIGVF